MMQKTHGINEICYNGGNEIERRGGAVTPLAMTRKELATVCSHSTRVLRHCAHCGAEFHPTLRQTTLYNGRGGRFCSRACSSLWQADRLKAVARDDLFWAKVDRRGDDECWEWTAALNDSGYGAFSSFDGQGRQRQGTALAHRISWVIENGTIPDGLFVCHHCDNRKCVNPSHLFLGTHADNMADAASKGRMHTSPRSRESNPNAKLTSEDVAEIRRTYRKGVRGRGSKILAARFGVSHFQILEIVNGRSWTKEDAA